MIARVLVTFLVLSCSPAPAPVTAGTSTAEVDVRPPASVSARSSASAPLLLVSAAPSVAPMTSAGPSASVAPSASAAPAEVLPEALDAPAVEKVLASAAKDLNRCAEPGRGTVQITISIGGDGRALTTFASGDGAGTLPDHGGVRACLSVVIEDLVFPRSQRGFRLDRMFKLPMKGR